MRQQMREQALRVQKRHARPEVFREGPEPNLTSGLDTSLRHFPAGRETSIWTEIGEMTARASIGFGATRMVCDRAGS